jgi:hypothetical protein
VNKLSGPERPDAKAIVAKDGKNGKNSKAKVGESMKDWLAREIAAKGYGGVQASHLIEGAPTILISTISADNMPVKALGNRKVSLIGHHLSSQPYLVAEAPSLKLETDDQSFLFDLLLGESAKVPGPNHLNLKLAEIPLESIAASLKSTDTTIRGGTVSVVSSGNWSRSAGLSLPLVVTLRKVEIPQLKHTIAQLAFPIEVTGAIDQPRIKFDSSQMTAALTGAGKAALREKGQAEVDKLLGKEGGKLDEKLGKGAGATAKGLIKGIFGGD